MIFFLCLCMVLLPLLLGRGALCLLYRKRPVRGTLLSDGVLTGYLIVVGLAGAAHMGAVLLGQSFSDNVRWFLGMLGVCAAAAAAVLLWDRRRERSAPRQQDFRGGPPINAKERALFFAFLVLSLLQLMRIVLGGERYLEGDMTVEAVNSFLITDDIYKINPLTGEWYQAGMPLRLKLLCLPTLYGDLCRLSGLEPEQVVWVAVPMLTWFCSNLAYWILAGQLFPESRERQGFFMNLVALFYLLGDTVYGADGFGVMHSGFRGIVIRAAVLLPYTVGAVLRRRWKLVVLCIAAEACMVWTFYGLGACLFTAVGLAAAGFVWERLRGRSGGKEASA